jgi:hypothetical protein
VLLEGVGFLDSRSGAGLMSALGQKQTFAVQKGMSALPPIADIGRRILLSPLHNGLRAMGYNARNDEIRDNATRG